MGYLKVTFVQAFLFLDFSCQNGPNGAEESQPQ